MGKIEDPFSVEPGNAEAEAEDEVRLSRRTFLRYAATALSSFIGLVIGVPAIGYISSPLLTPEKHGQWVPLGSVDQFAKSQAPTVVQFSLTRQDGWVEDQQARTCWVVPQPDGSFTVFNGRCTHLGCAYSWKTSGEYADEFHCPCHDGVYDREGNVVSGPPPRPLDRLETRIQDGQLSAFYEDFRLGVPDEEPL